MNLYSIYDDVSESYVTNPMVYQTSGELIRDFKFMLPSFDATQRARFRDCKLYLIGRYDVRSFASLEAYDPPRFVCALSPIVERNVEDACNG